VRGWRVRRRVAAARQSARADAGSDGEGPDEPGGDDDPDRWLPSGWRLDAAAGGGGRGGEAAPTSLRGAGLEGERRSWLEAEHRAGPESAPQHGDADNAGRAAGADPERWAWRAHAAAGAQVGAVDPATSGGGPASAAAHDGRGGRDEVQTHARCLRRSVQARQLYMGAWAATRAAMLCGSFLCTTRISGHALARVIVRCVEIASSKCFFSLHSRMGAPVLLGWTIRWMSMSASGSPGRRPRARAQEAVAALMADWGFRDRATAEAALRSRRRRLRPHRSGALRRRLEQARWSCRWSCHAS
jgi:hypothetical protein